MTEWVTDGRGEWTYRNRAPGNGQPDGGEGLQVDVVERDGRAWWVLAEYDEVGLGADLADGSERTVPAAKRAGLRALESWPPR